MLLLIIFKKLQANFTLMLLKPQLFHSHFSQVYHSWGVVQMMDKVDMALHNMVEHLCNNNDIKLSIEIIKITNLN